MAKLNQVVAIESGVKTRTNAQVSELYKAAQHPALFEGFSKKYSPLAEDGEKFPPETKNVQQTVKGVLSSVAKTLTELFDVTAQKDFANREANANVTVDGTVLLTAVPVPYLLFLEKQLTDIHTLVAKLPVLDPAETWSEDVNSGLYRTEPTQTIKTKKVQKALVLHPGTEKHPPQTQLITDDVTVGNWDQTKFSGAMPAPERARLLSRVERLQQAVKFAREEANGQSAPAQDMGSKVFGYLLG